jgi:hypothetical protein
MKNFSELLATDQSLVLDITLAPEFETVPPRAKVEINGYAEELVVSEVTHRQLIIPILDAITVKITLEPSDVHDYLYGLEIKNLRIDSHELMPDLCYLASLSANIQHYAPTNHISNHGQWIFEIDRPFYRWWHMIKGHGWLLEP